MGTARSLEDKKTVACIWKGGTKGTVIKPMDGDYAGCQVVAINSANAVAGSIKLVGSISGKKKWRKRKKRINYIDIPWVWTEEKGMVALPSPIKEGRSKVMAMNDRGDVLMQVYKQGKFHYFLITDKGAIELPEYPEAARTKYRDVNSKRQLVGSAYMDDKGTLGFVATIPDSVKAAKVKEPVNTDPPKAEPPVAVKAGEWVLQGKRLDAGDVQNAIFKRTNEGMVFQAEKGLGRIDLPVKPGTSYEIRCMTSFTTESHNLQFVLPVGKTGVTLAWSSIKNSVAGLSRINGKFAPSSKNPTRTKAYKFREGEKYSLRVIVKTSGDKAEIDAWIGDDDYIKWKGSTSELKSGRPCKPGTISFLVIGNKTGVILKNIQTRTLE